ncbi:hypothetical protein L0657_12260 [Dyadobacter sp. CY345]|uniref:hypothetical protein n=1 Tax=Dyadobacter sp. CY345 TaxID=2909335 RepID=UPI001F15D0F1|nr:hypothetical protein [Dyadobacter sp. CY345]MCF2444733.1 hypothetical protein [Dyadobacter sp. CY345]
MLDFEIDKLTNSIENSVTGEKFETVVVPLNTAPKKKDWLFDWKIEQTRQERSIFKLVTTQNPNVIHGLISLSINQDHVFMHLIENSIFNKGAKKMYLGVAGNLIAHACKLSFELGFDGIVVFESKTRLIAHYQLSIGAKILAGNRMFIDVNESNALVKRYFK